jgi:putative transcriptional regulator
MNEDSRLSSLGAEMLAGLTAFCDALESGEPIEERFTVRTVHRDPNPKSYEASDVKDVRKRLNASQAVFAKTLGVSVKTLRSWEQGTRGVPAITCRILDKMIANPDLWKQPLSELRTTEKGKVGGP